VNGWVIWIENCVNEVIRLLERCAEALERIAEASEQQAEEELSE
jgi:hypothetical protein